jgi:hypothetical protein
MHMNDTNANAMGPISVPTDRRSRAHLRDLCDEVLASFRAASDRDLFTEQDRRTGHALLRSIGSRSAG